MYDNTAVTNLYDDPHSCHHPVWQLTQVSPACMTTNTAVSVPYDNPHSCRHPLWQLTQLSPSRMRTHTALIIDYDDKHLLSSIVTTHTAVVIHCDDPHSYHDPVWRQPQLPSSIMTTYAAVPPFFMTKDIMTSSTGGELWRRSTTDKAAKGRWLQPFWLAGDFTWHYARLRWKGTRLLLFWCWCNNNDTYY